MDAQLIDYAIKKIAELEKKLEIYYSNLNIKNELDLILNGKYIVDDDLDSIINGNY